MVVFTTRSVSVIVLFQRVTNQFDLVRQQFDGQFSTLGTQGLAVSVSGQQALDRCYGDVLRLRGLDGFGKIVRLINSRFGHYIALTDGEIEVLDPRMVIFLAAILLSKLVGLNGIRYL